MRFIENFRYALGAIALNKKRSFLTMIGIIIGLGAVITIVSVGDTISFVVKEFFLSSFGGNTVYMLSAEKGGDGLNYNEKYIFTEDDVNKFLENAPDGIVDITMNSDFLYKGKAFISDECYSSADVSGVSPGVEQSGKLKILAGRFISKQDCEYAKPVCVISDIAAENCFGSVENAVGKQIRLQGEYIIPTDPIDPDDPDAAAKAKMQAVPKTDSVGTECAVVGIYKYEDTDGSAAKVNDRRKFSTNIYCPYSYQDYLGNIEDNSYGAVLTVVCKDNDSVTAVRAYAQNFLADRFPDDPDYIYMVNDLMTELQPIIMVINVITIVFVMVAAVSLLVGGIGLMNTMLVSVTERTKEIGIKKALGAKKSVIRAQFLTESVTICLIACAIGVFLGMLIGTIIEMNLDKLIDLVTNETLAYFLRNTEIHVTPSVSAVVISVIFSVAVGSIFGLYPANKGAKMQPVDALRYE